MSKVLVVDDEVGIRALLVALLSDEGHDVIAAGDGRSALTLAEQERPDLLLLDIMLPALDGREVYRKVREIEGLERLPVIFMSAAALPPVSEPSTAFVSKPFELDRLLTCVANMLAGNTDLASYR
ncbi:MAG: response regulator [Chloroflexi bacterium]|nr:response regulator [Chloroflexota bacterium]